MKLSRKSEYAILALLELAKIDEKKLIKTADISRKKNIPQKYLEQILIILKRTGYVKSTRGSTGGFSLSKKPSEINLAEIIRLIDGPIAPVNSVSIHFYEETPIEQNKKALALFRQIRDYVSEKLENTSLANLL